MSHYSVAVFHRNDHPDLEAILAPYDEEVEPGSDYSEFVEDDDCEVDEISGQRGFWANPGAKWDWWVIGGRFSGLLTLEDGRTVDSACLRDLTLDQNFETYAFITEDGKWHEPGQMGWFGVSGSTSETEEAYNKDFRRYLKLATQNKLWITIVDCHI